MLTSFLCHVLLPYTNRRNGFLYVRLAHQMRWTRETGTRGCCKFPPHSDTCFFVSIIQGDATTTTTATTNHAHHITWPLSSPSSHHHHEPMQQHTPWVMQPDDDATETSISDAAQQSFGSWSRQRDQHWHLLLQQQRHHRLYHSTADALHSISGWWCWWFCFICNK